MSNVDTLARDGLDLQAMEGGSTAELLEWHCVAGGHLPDADTTVLMWVQDGAVAEWFAGWWDGEAWLDAASGGMVAGVVTHWAEPEGPAAC